MIGETPYGIKAAAKVGIQTIAFRSGGWSDKYLAKAIARYETSVLVKGIDQEAS
jgi:hypothetical protein